MLGYIFIVRPLDADELNVTDTANVTVIVRAKSTAVHCASVEVAPAAKDDKFRIVVVVLSIYPPNADQSRARTRAFTVVPTGSPLSTRRGSRVILNSGSCSSSIQYIHS